MSIIKNIDKFIFDLEKTASFTKRKAINRKFDAVEKQRKLTKKFFDFETRKIKTKSAY